MQRSLAAILGVAASTNQDSSNETDSELSNEEEMFPPNDIPPTTQIAFQPSYTFEDYDSSKNKRDIIPLPS